MMSDERRRRRSPESSRRSRRKARRDEREHPKATLYSYPSQSQAFQQPAESPIPPITMRSASNDNARPSTSAMPMSVPIPSELNRPQRRRRSRHGSESSSDFTYSSSGSSSSSYLDISRWYPSYGRAGGVLKAFFKTPSEHKPRRWRSRKQVKTKKTKAIFGFGNNSSSSSVNSDMAYGMGFIRKPKSRGGESSPGYNAAAVTGKEASSSRPGVQRRQTDEEILEIGRKLAQVAREQNQEDLRRMGKKPPPQFVAAMNSWDKYRQSTGEQSIHGGRGIAPSRSDRRHGYSSDDESEWESASEDEGSDGSSGLAYGFHNKSATPKPSTPKTSRSSVFIAPSPREARQVLERKSSVVDPSLFGPVNSLRNFVNTPCGFDEKRGTYPAAGTGQGWYTGSAGTAESASAEARPLQTVYPIVTSDPGKMDAARDSGSIVTIQQNNYSTVNSRDRVYATTVVPTNDRPDPVPIQAPKPIAPVPTSLYEEQRVHDCDRSSSRERRRQSSEYRGDRYDSRDRRRQSGDFDTGRSESREKRRKPGDSKIFAETALVGAGVAALGAAMMAHRDKGKGKDPELSHGRDERYGHDDHRQDDTKVQDSRRAKELALEKEIERLEKALAGRNKARELRRRDSKRNSAPADLEKDYEHERERRRGERFSRTGDTDGDIQPESSKRVSEARGQAPITSDTDRHLVHDEETPETKGNVDVFQYQISDDAFEPGTTPLQAPLPVIIDVTPAPSPAPDQGRKSRRESFEDEMRDARHIVEEASHSTAPISEVAMAAAIAATEHSRRHDELEDRNRGRTSSRAERDQVQEEANRYYHARRIAEREIRSRSRSRSPDGEVRPPRIVTPPEMKERPKVYDYSKPNADIIFDNEFSPTELRSFLPREAPVRDPSAERPRPVLNLILPTPVPTPSPEKMEHRKPTSRFQEAADDEPAKDGPTVIIGPKGDIVQIVDAPEPRDEVPEPPTPKSVSWGPSETKQYEVESPERSRERTPESSERSSRSSKRSSGGWGAIAAALAGATAGAAIARDHDGQRSEGSRSPPKERPILPAGTSSRAIEEEPEEPPPMPGPKPASPRSPQMPGAFADDLEFTANVAAGLEHAGFPSDIVVEDPNFRRRDSPPGSNEPFTGVYTQPFSETVSDLGIMGLDDRSRPVRESGYILGEVADTPASERGAVFDDRSTEPTAFATPKLSKKEQRKLEKAARATKLAEEEQQQQQQQQQQAARSIEGGEDDWADAASSKKSKKSKKSKRSSVTWDDEDTPVNDAPTETFADFQETKSSKNDDDDWGVPKKAKKSKRSSKSYEPVDEDSPERRDHRRDAYEALHGDVASVVSDSRYDDRSDSHGRDDDRSVVSAPPSSDRKRDSKSEKRSSGSGFWSLLKSSNGTDSDDKKVSKKDNAGTLGAGAGLAGVAVAATALAGGMAIADSDAAEAPSGQEEPYVGRDVDQSARRVDSPSREVDVFEDPDIVPRVIKPAIDPQYGDLLPLPPSPGERNFVDFEADNDLPALPDSRPTTPPGQDRGVPRERSVSGQKRPGLTSHSRRTSAYETPLRSPSHTAIPIQFRMGQRPASIISPASSRPAGSGSPALGRASPTPQSPVASSGQEFSPTFKRTPRPTSWDRNKEFKPLYLLEQAGRSTRDAEEGLGESSPESIHPPLSREPPAPETELEADEHEMAPGTEYTPLGINMESIQAVPSRSQENTPKSTTAAEFVLPPLAEDVELTPFETPIDVPFGGPSTSSLPGSDYATPIESPSQATERAPVSDNHEVDEHAADTFDHGKPDLPKSSQPTTSLTEEVKPQEVPETQQKKSYFPSAFSMLPATTLAGVGALLSRGKHDEAVTDPANRAIRADSGDQSENLTAEADKTSTEDTRETNLSDQSGSAEHGAAGARKSPTDTTSSSVTDTADASVPNELAAAVPTGPEEPPAVDESQPIDAVIHDVHNQDDSLVPAVVETPGVLLPSSLPRETEADLNTTPTKPQTDTEDMETIIETPADTIDWPMETASKKKKGKKTLSVSDAPQAPLNAGSDAFTPPVDVQEDAAAPDMDTFEVADEPGQDAHPPVAPDADQTEVEPVQVALALDAPGSDATETKDLEDFSGTAYHPQIADHQGLSDELEGFQAPVEMSESISLQDTQGVIVGDRPLKSSTGRRLRSSRVMSPHGSVDEYMSSDAVQSGEDTPMSPASGLKTTGKRYKKTRSLRSSRRSSAASLGSGQENVISERRAPGDTGESAPAVPDVEQFRDTTEEPTPSTPELIGQPADAPIGGVDQFLSKETENIEEPSAPEAEVNPDPIKTKTDTGADAITATDVPNEDESLQDTKVATESMPHTEAQVDDDWAPTPSKTSKKNKKKKKTQSISLINDPMDKLALEQEAEEAADNNPKTIAPLELTSVAPDEHLQDRDLTSEQHTGEENSLVQPEPGETTQIPPVSEDLGEGDQRLPSDAEALHTVNEPGSPLQGVPEPLTDEPATVEEKTLDEQLLVQPVVDKPSAIESSDLPLAPEAGPEPTVVSPEEEFPVVSSKKSKKNKKRRKSSTILDEAVQSSGTATPAEFDQAGQEVEVQETSNASLPREDLVVPPASETLDDAVAARTESPVFEGNNAHPDESIPAEGVQLTESDANSQEQSGPQEALQTRDVSKEPVLEFRPAALGDSQDSAKHPETATSQRDALETSVPAGTEAGKDDLVQAPAEGIQPAEVDASSIPVTEDAGAIVTSTSVEAQTAEDETPQPEEPIEPTDSPIAPIPEEVAAKTAVTERQQETEIPVQEDLKAAVDDEDTLRHEAETAQAEEEEAEIARLQSKKRLKPKDKQRLRELKARSEERAAKAEVVTTVPVEEEAPVDNTVEADVTAMPSSEEEAFVVKSPGAEVGEDLKSTADATVESLTTEAAAPTLTSEDTSPLITKDPTPAGGDTIETQQTELPLEMLPEDTSASAPEQREEEAPMLESVDIAEDPEEIARREAEEEVVRREESELARLKNKKKLNKKDKERMKVLRASAEFREREAEALQRQIEEREAAVAAQEAHEESPAEAEAESNETRIANKTTEALSVEGVESAQPEGSDRPEFDMTVLSQPEEQLKIVDQEHADAPSHVQLEEGNAPNVEDATEAKADHAASDLADSYAIEKSFGTPTTLVEQTIPLPEYTTSDIHNRSLQQPLESHVSQDVSIQETGDLPESLVEQDQASSPTDQSDKTESTMPEKSEVKTAQEAAPLPLPEEPIVLPEYQMGEIGELGGRAEAEVVTESVDLPQTKSDEVNTLPERNVEQVVEDARPPPTHMEGTIEYSPGPQSQDLAPEPPSEPMPTSELLDVASLEENSAADAVQPEPEPEPVFTTKKPNKDNKKKRKGTVSESNDQASSTATPVETSEPAIAVEALPADDPLPTNVPLATEEPLAIEKPLTTDVPVQQPSVDEASLNVDMGVEPIQQLESRSPDQTEPAVVPSIAEDEPISGAQEVQVPSHEDEVAQTPATGMDEVTAVAPEAEQEASPKEPEFTVSTKKSKKDKRKKRKGTISGPSPGDSGTVTPIDIQDAPQEPPPETLGASEDPVSNLGVGSVPVVTADTPLQEQFPIQEEPSTAPKEAEAATFVEMPQDPIVQELLESDIPDDQVPVHAEDSSSMLVLQQADTLSPEKEITNEAWHPEVAQSPIEQEQTDLPTSVEALGTTAPLTTAEIEARPLPAEFVVHDQEPTADQEPEREAVQTTTALPEEVQADDFFVVPTKKNKRDKKKKRASAAWLESESGAQTPVVEDPIVAVSKDTTEAVTDVGQLSSASSDLPPIEAAEDLQVALNDWAPVAPSKKSKKDKKKKQASGSSWEVESGAQTPISEEIQELQNTPEPTIGTAEQEDVDLVMQPTTTESRASEVSLPRELADTQNTADAAATAATAATVEGSGEIQEVPTASDKPDAAPMKSGGGWGRIAAGLGGGNSDFKHADYPTLPAEPLEPETETISLPTEKLAINDAPVAVEAREEEPQPQVQSFDEPKTSRTKSMGGWDTIAVAVAGVTVGATESSADKIKHETSPPRAIEDLASPNKHMTKPELESKANDSDKTSIFAGGERTGTQSDSVSAPIPKPDLEDKVEDGEDTLIVAGGETAHEDTEPWSFEASRDAQPESISQPDLDKRVDDGDDTVIVAGGQTFEEYEPRSRIGDPDEPVAEQVNDFLDVDRPAMRPSSPVPWEDEDRMDEFAAPGGQHIVQDDEAEAAAVPNPREVEPESFESVTGKKSKKDKKKKERGGASQSQGIEPKVPTPLAETPQFEEALDQQPPAASLENPGHAEPVDLSETKPADEEAEALDWIPKKMSKKEKRKAKKSSMLVSDPKPIVTIPDDSQEPDEVVINPQDVTENVDETSSSQRGHDVLVDETRRDLPVPEVSNVIVEPAQEKEEPLVVETLATQPSEASVQERPESIVAKSTLDAPTNLLSTEPEFAPSNEPGAEETPIVEKTPDVEDVPVLPRKMSKKEKRRAKKKATSSWEEDAFEPAETTLMGTEDTTSQEKRDLLEQPEPVQDETVDVPSSTIIPASAEVEPIESVTPAGEEIVAEDEWAPISRKKSKKDKKKKGKQQASQPASGSQTPIIEEQLKEDLPETSEPIPLEPQVPEVLKPSEEDQGHSVKNPRELATEQLAPSASEEYDRIDSLAEKQQEVPPTSVGIDDWEEARERSEPTKVGLRSPAALGAELQKVPSAAPSPDIWDNEDYFRPKEPNDSRNSPSDKPIEKFDIHPAFSRDFRANSENRGKDERPLVGLGLIHRHSSIFQDDDGHAPKLLTLGADNFSVESLAVDETVSSDLSQRDVSKAIGKQSGPARRSTLPTEGAGLALDENVQYTSVPRPPPSPGLDDVNKMSKKGSVALLAERFGGTTKNATGKNKKTSKYVDKRTPQEDVFDEPAMWEGSERKPIEGSRMDLDAGDFWAVSDTELDEAKAEPDMLAGQGATTAHGQESKAGDDNVSATHSPTSPEVGAFTPKVSEQAGRGEEVPMESLVVESPVLGSQVSFELSPKVEQTAIEPLDRPPDIDTGQTADLPAITMELTPDEPKEDMHGLLHTPRSLSPAASDRGVRLDRAISPSAEADDYALQQGISPVSEFRRSVSRGLAPVQEEPHDEDGAVGKTTEVNRDSGFVTGSPHPPLSRHFDDFQQQRDSGVHLRDYPDISPRLESEGSRFDDRPRRSPLVENPKRRQLSESTPVLQAQETPVTPEPQKSRSPTRRSRKQYPDLGPEAAAASLIGGAALLSGAGSERRSVSDQAEKRQVSGSGSGPGGDRRAVSNTGISRSKTPEPLNLRSESPSVLRYSGTPPLRSRRTRSGDLRTLSQLSNGSHSDITPSALLQPSLSPSPVSGSGAVDPANAPTAINPPGPASSSSSSDLRRPTTSPHHNPSNTSKNTNNTQHTPLANEGRVRSKDMADVYDGFGEGRLGSPRSPTRPHSMRRRQSMQVLELESRVEQLVAENRALAEARLQAEQHSSNRATSTLAERDNEIESLKQSLDFMRKEIQRLTEVNEGLNSAIAQSAVQHEDRYRILEIQHADANRELNLFRGRRNSTSQTIQEKDAEIQDLRQQLEATKEQIRDMQRQILASKPADSDFLRIKDVDYFDHRCQQLCSHVQQWVLRFSKFSDMRACRLTSELNDEKIIDRLDNAVLDGSNVDSYLNDRVRRRDIFMSLAMTMIWEFVFTRYLFGMDREQRQKLKALEKLLLEVGPPHAVRQWRAVTLTLLSERESFKSQRDQDTEAVVQAVFQTLCMILPPPSNLEDQIQNQLRKVMREAVDLSIEMRTQRAEYMMLPPLQPEYDANGDLAEPHPFNATLMNERSGDKSIDNDDLQAQGSIVRVVLFPLVVKKGDDDGVGDDEVVVCPAQVIVARPRSSSRRSMRAPSSDAGGVSLLRGGSPSTAPNRSNVSMAEAEYIEGGI